MDFEGIPRSEVSSAFEEPINPSDNNLITNNSFRISGVNRIEIPQFLFEQRPLGKNIKY